MTTQVKELKDMSVMEWIEDIVYPAVFENMDRVFPEHKFKRYSQGWRSQTYLNGTPHKDRIDKTVVINWRPKYMLQQGEKEMDLTVVTEAIRKNVLAQGGGEVAIPQYVMKRDGVDYITAMKTVAKRAGLKIPKDKFSKTDNGVKSILIKNFSLEAFFRIMLGCIGIFFGLRVINMGSTGGGVFLCALGIMIMLGIKNSRGQSLWDTILFGLFSNKK